MTLWDVIKRGYHSGWAFMIACPLLFLFPVAIELVQHAAEVHIGMYDSVAMAKATEHHPLRMGFGILKIFALFITTYWATRFAAFGNDATAPTRRDPVAFRLFGIYLLVQVALSCLGLYISTFGGMAVLAQFLVSQILVGLWLLWGTAAALGNPAIGPVQSARHAGAYSLWIGFFGFAAILLLMIPHYALAIIALMLHAGPLALWAFLIIDSLLVGLLAAIMGCISWYLAQWVADKRGVPLLPLAQ